MSHSTAAPRARESVTGSRSRISGVTGFWVTNEYPRHGAGHDTTFVPV